MKPDLLVIVGPTGVGKTDLSLQLAKDFNGEIISADSMQVYRGMDIGTAKVSLEERAVVPHHLIDILAPDDSFSVQQYQQLARKKVAEIYERDHLPILVGGTGLYIDSVVHEYTMADVTEDPSLRKELEVLAELEGNELLHKRLQQVDPITAARLHPNDRRRVIRALEVFQLTGKPLSKQQGRKNSPYNVLWIGLTMPRELLYEQINKRVDKMLKAGLETEVRQLLASGILEHHTSIQAIGYKEMVQYLQGRLTLDEAVEAIKQGSRRYAKRQLSWFRHIYNIHWFDTTEAHAFIEINHLVAGKFPSYRE